MKKLYIILLVLFIASNAFGATQLLKTVKPSGGDYTSLEVCMNDNEQDLTTADKYFDVEIDGSWSSADPTAVIITGYITDATHFINIYTTATARHNGIYSTDYYRLAITDGVTPYLYSAVDNVTLDGIQAIAVSMDRAGYIISWAGGTVKNCLVRGAGNASYFLYAVKLVTSTNYCFNNIIYGIGNNGSSASIRIDSGTAYLYSNTCRGESNTWGIFRTGGTVTAKNCYSGGSPGYDYSGTITKTTCASSDTTGDIDNVAVNTTNFTNVTGGSEDFRLPLGSALIDVGTDTSGEGAPLNFTTDITGATRSGTWDIGADEYVSSGGATGYQTTNKGYW